MKAHAIHPKIPPKRMQNTEMPGKGSRRDWRKDIKPVGKRRFRREWSLALKIIDRRLLEEDATPQEDRRFLCDQVFEVEQLRKYVVERRCLYVIPSLN